MVLTVVEVESQRYRYFSERMSACTKKTQMFFVKTIVLSQDNGIFAKRNDKSSRLPMPKIFEYFGFIFFFYSNEHEPIHVHVNKNGCGVIFEILMENGKLVELRQRASTKMPPLSAKDVATAETFVKTYYRNIVEKWVNFFIYKKRIRSTKITKRL